jgi:hypothetical protein
MGGKKIAMKKKNYRSMNKRLSNIYNLNLILTFSYENISLTLSKNDLSSFSGLGSK